MSMMGTAVGQQEDVTVISNSKDMVDTVDRMLKAFEAAEDKQTNFERITESPEKLAEWLAKHYDYCTYADCDNCPVNNEDGSCGNEGKTDYEIWLWWLKQEAE